MINFNYTGIQLTAYILLLYFACNICNLNALDQSTFDILLNCIFDIDLHNLIALFFYIQRHITKPKNKLSMHMVDISLN
jgi:hypothetical protein